MNAAGRHHPAFILRHPILFGFLAAVGAWIALALAGAMYSISRVQPTGPLGTLVWSNARAGPPSQFVLLVQDDGNDELVLVSEARRNGATVGPGLHELVMPARYGEPSDARANKPGDRALELIVDLHVGSSNMGARLLSGTRVDIGGGATRQTITLFDDMGNEWSYVYTRRGPVVTLEEAWAAYDAIAELFAMFHAAMLAGLAIVPAAMVWVLVTGVLAAWGSMSAARAGGRGSQDGHSRDRSSVPLGGPIDSA